MPEGRPLGNSAEPRTSMGKVVKGKFCAPNEELMLVASQIALFKRQASQEPFVHCALVKAN